MLIIKAERTVDRHRRHRNKNNRRGTVSDALPVRRRRPVLPLQSGIREEERGRRRRLGGVQARVRHLARKLHTRALRTRVAYSSSVCLATQELCADVTKISGSYDHLQRFPLRGSVVNATVFIEAV